MNGKIGAPHSPARWLQENIASIPPEHGYALIEMVDGAPRLVVSGTKRACHAAATDKRTQVVCELDKYRRGA